MEQRQRRKKIKKVKSEGSKPESDADAEDEFKSNSLALIESGKADALNRRTPNTAADSHSTIPSSPIPSLDGALLNQFIDTHLKALNLLFGNKQCSEGDQAAKIVLDQLRIGSKLADLYSSLNDTILTAPDAEVQVHKEKPLVFPEFDFESDIEITVNEDSLSMRMNSNHCNNCTEQVSCLSPVRLVGERLTPADAADLPRRSFNRFPAESNFQSNEQHLRSPERQGFAWPNLLLREEERNLFVCGQKEPFCELLAGQCSRRGSLHRYLESDE